MTPSIRRLSLLALLALLAVLIPLARPARAATLTVTTTADSGPGSLRQAILDANASTGGDTIAFNIPTSDPGFNAAGYWTIRPLSPLPALTGGDILIDGTTQPGGRTTGPKIVLDGTQTLDPAFGNTRNSHGIKITSANNTIKGLVINNFARGIGLGENSGGAGVYIAGPGATGNRVIGCYIGTAPDGATAAGNSDWGVAIDDGASNNVIGGTGPGEGNVISGNGSGSSGPSYANVVIGGVDPNSTSPPSGNRVVGNLIGTNATGSAAIGGGNPGNGVLLQGRATANIIGGLNAAERNVISGHNNELFALIAAGISIGTQPPQPDNQILGNYIGTNSSGTAAIPNQIGVWVHGAQNTVIGSAAAGGRNIISGNIRNGVRVELASSTDTTIAGNWIGVAANGNALGNGEDGVRFLNKAGPATVGPGNLVAHNGASGILVIESTGINITRTETRNNTGNGIELQAGGNGGVSAPSLQLNGAMLSGTAAGCANCEIEVFTGPAPPDNGEGPRFLTRTMTDGSGNFSVNVGGCDAYLTATARYLGNNTSPFTNPMVGVCTATQVFGVDIEPPRTGQAPPGGTVVYTHIITNTGSGVDSITLSASSTPGFSASFPDGDRCDNLAAGASCTRRVQVNVAPDVALNQGTTTVTARSVGDPTKSDSVDDLTQVAPVARPAIAPTAQTRDIRPPQTTAVFTHTVTNIGNQTGTFTVTVGSPPPGWTFALSAPTSFALDPGASRPITLTVTAPSPAPDAGTLVTATLTVASSGGAQATATDTVRVLQQTSFAFSPASQPVADGLPGRTVAFTHTLTNTGNGPDTFTITVTPTGGLTADPIDPIALGRGASAPVVVRAHIPPGLPPGTQTLSVTARAASDPSLAITRTDTVNVLGAAVPALSTTRPLSATAPMTVTFSHTLTNTGNLTGTFVLSATAPPGWSAAPGAPACLADLPPGSTCPFTMTVSVPADADAGPNSVLLTATAQDSIGASDRVTDTVLVAAVPGLAFAPDRTGSADPGAVVTYTHTLTNTGNGPDTFTIALATDPGWSATVTPTFIALPRRGTQTIIVSVTAPTGVLFGSTGAVTATATSALDPQVRASVVDRTTLNPRPGAALIPAEQTLNADPTATTSDTVVFTHTLRNSGSVPISYTLQVTNTQAGWTATVVPTATGTLTPGLTITISVRVTAPAGTPLGTENITYVSVRAQDSPAIVLAAARDTTLVGPRFGVGLAPERNDGTALPGETITYTHRLTNMGVMSDTFVLAVLASNGWTTRVTPTRVSLPRGGSVPISVTVQVPTTALSGTLDLATLIAQSASDGLTTARAYDYTTVPQVAGVSLSPPQTRAARPGSEIVFQHTLTNTGNGPDTFTLTATGTLAWPITITPASQSLPVAGSYPAVLVRVQVPSSAPLGVENRITIIATSQSQPEVSSTVEDVIRTAQQATGDYRVHIPIVARQ
jgi:uncharacterized membrane protein